MAAQNLSKLIRSTFESAQQHGSLVFSKSVTSSIRTLEGIPFEIRLAPSLASKPSEYGGSKQKSEKKANPFLPYDPTLYITNFESHNLLLNKFSLVEGHVLLTTKEFASQFDPLNESDFAAAWKVLSEPDTSNYLVFYNCGENSGASVPHKHVQLIPPSTDSPDGTFPPIQSVIEQYRSSHEIYQPFVLTDLAFAHSIALLPTKSSTSTAPTAGLLESTYRALITSSFEMARLDPQPCLQPSALLASGIPDPEAKHTSYNFVMTSDFMMIVPRRAPVARTIAINSVAFAGLMLAKSEPDLDVIRDAGPIQLLKEVAFPIMP
ncbi:HIT-like domain-containing protein [Phlyctochytrium arcticum]|nr:HIT-like domain-containing protein [Phlyctochytrium arcticum]